MLDKSLAGAALNYLRVPATVEVGPRRQVGCTGYRYCLYAVLRWMVFGNDE